MRNYVLARKMTQRHVPFQHTAADAHENWFSPDKLSLLLRRLSQPPQANCCGVVQRDVWYETVEHLQTVHNALTEGWAGRFRCSWTAWARSVHTALHRTCVRPHTHRHINDLPIMHPFVRARNEFEMTELSKYAVIATSKDPIWSCVT